MDILCCIFPIALSDLFAMIYHPTWHVQLSSTCLCSVFPHTTFIISISEYSLAPVFSFWSCCCLCNLSHLLQCCCKRNGRGEGSTKSQYISLVSNSKPMMPRLDRPIIPRQTHPTILPLPSDHPQTPADTTSYTSLARCPMLSAQPNIFSHLFVHPHWCACVGQSGETRLVPRACQE